MIQTIVPVDIETSISYIDAYRGRPERLVAGVMSGTSLDAIDVALVRVGGTGASLSHELVAFQAVEFDPAMKGRLMAAAEGTIMIRDAFELDADLGGVYADAIEATIRSASIAAGTLDAVGLHGQTVYHAPRRGGAGVTAQIGSAAIVAERLRAIVVNDFRSADVAAGGEGAPLVPYCDFALLRSTELNRVALNIGGIANITWLPTDARPDHLVAFDTGPGNMMIDAAMRELRGEEFDAGGALAAEGTVDREWLDALMADPFYSAQPPKSAGREHFGEEAARRLVCDARSRGVADADVVATLTALTARTIGRAVVDFASRGARVDEIIVGGGGARNATLLRMLASEMPGAEVLPADDFGLPADAKEAICFAILANEALMETRANVISVTGAARPVVCGSIRLP
jgi:anhydro-N-acetylmuramic acid kinase